MRKAFAALAFRLSEAALIGAARVRTARWRHRMIAWSFFFSDLECWLEGLGSWPRLRASHSRQSQH